MENLLAITPIDGRYISKTKHLSNYFSEYALFKYRLFVEIQYFIELCKSLKIEINIKKIMDIYNSFNIEECMVLKNIEKSVNHDVKSVELYLIKKFVEKSIPYYDYIHFGLTSQDINNVSISLSLKLYIEEEFYKNIQKILNNLDTKYKNWKNIIMLSRTHGQPAVPSSIGKELYVFHYRINKELNNLKEIKYYSKFGGAVGNFNAHMIAYPEIDWCEFGNNFLKKLNLYRSEYTTQIDNYENLSIIFDNVKRINTVLVDMCRDIWHYISIEYFKQKFDSNEVGSSTMPHKINPINFENAEGNLLLSISLLEFLSRKLPISRLQRDLTDSTILRNLGLVFGYCEIAYHNLLIGLDKLEPNKDKIETDLNNNSIVLTEGIQTILRKYGDDKAYDKLKDFCRNNDKKDMFDIKTFIENLDVEEHIKEELNNLDINNYIGYLNDKN